MADVIWAIRTTDTISEEVDGSLLVYDTRIDHVQCLDETAARVYRAAEGRTVAQIADAVGLTEGEVADHLLKLSELDLVDSNTDDHSRRKFLKLAAAGTAVGIWSLAAPSPAAAASGETTTPDTTTTEERPP